MLHDDRVRAGSFGDDAAQYDRTRPTYPAALIDDLVAGGPARVLDVGAGTGIVSRLLLARGCEVLAIDPDERMAELARASGVVVEPGTFEEWSPDGRVFDLVVAGQSWHWVHPDRGSAKARSVSALRPSTSIGASSRVSEPCPFSMLHIFAPMRMEASTT